MPVKSCMEVNNKRQQGRHPLWPATKERRILCSFRRHQSVVVAVGTDSFCRGRFVPFVVTSAEKVVSISPPPPHESINQPAGSLRILVLLFFLLLFQKPYLDGPSIISQGCFRHGLLAFVAIAFPARSYARLIDPRLRL